jgi:hypothetical protein
MMRRIATLRAREGSTLYALHHHMFATEVRCDPGQIRAGRTQMPKTDKEQARESQETANDLARLVCKLRWLGMEHEADALADQLARQDIVDRAAVASQSCDTD